MALDKRYVDPLTSEALLDALATGLASKVPSIEELDSKLRLNADGKQAKRVEAEPRIKSSLP